ncbi:MAG: ROK family protein, partial [Thermomicrobiales bacterium]
IDAARHEVMLSVPQQWFHVPLGAMLEDRLGMPVVIANRAKAAALGEYWQGQRASQAQGTPAGRPSSLFYAYVGAGIVSGFVNEGQLHLGSGGAAGELGHVTILPDGPVCGCGNRGCLYTLASESAIIRQVKARMREVAAADPAASLADPLAESLAMLDIAMVVEAARRGHPVVLETIREVATWLGIAIAGVINLMNPSHVVIGGPVTGIGEPFITALREEIWRRALWDSLRGVSVETSILGDDAGPIGAAALFLDLAHPGDLLAGTGGAAPG